MGLGEGRALHWVADPLHHTKFPWFEIFVCLFPCFMFLFVCVCVFVCLVCLFLLLCISIILSEQVNDFAFSGIFEVEESHKELSICPRHRDDFDFTKDWFVWRSSLRTHFRFSVFWSKRFWNICWCSLNAVFKSN